MAPHIIRLDESAEAFLYGAKNFLRDVTRTLAIAFDCDLHEASDFGDLKDTGGSKATKWAAKALGGNSRLADFLRRHTAWITEVARRRNASEHPDGHSGRLIVQNVRVISQDPYKVWPPMWERSPHVAQTSMLADMRAIITNLLDFAECIAAEAVLAKVKFKAVEVREVPEAERDPSCPVRLRMMLADGVLKGTPRPEGAT